MKSVIKSIAVLAAAVLVAACSGKKTYEYPFQNPRLSVDERVENLLSLLTPEEKIGLMMNGSVSVDRLGIPAYNWWSEACHGICQDGVTVFPQAIALAASFDADQQLQVYTAVSDEARAFWNISDHNEFGKTAATGGAWHKGLSFWCPNINIFRDPRWGRGQETSGEDPFLTGTMGTQTVKGMQGNDSKYFKTVACAKHYAVHSGPEPLRHRFDVTVSMRDLWETYLPAFKMLVQDGNVQQVMCAYNRYEGEPCCGSDRLLSDILRKKWGYDAIIVSDCGAINNFYTKGQHETHPDAASASADAVLSGTDIECGTSYNALIESLRKGLISEADIDVSMRRILKERFELGMFDPAEDMPWAKLDSTALSSPEHSALARKAAREAIVLLKNEGNVLPISKDIKKIAVVGPNADNSVMHLGNYNGTPTGDNTLSIVGAIRQAVPDAEVIYNKGCELADKYITTYRLKDINEGKGLHAEFFNNTDLSGKPVAAGDYGSINMSTMGDYRFAEGVEANNFSARLTGRFVSDFTGDLYYMLRSRDKYTLKVNGHIVGEQNEQNGGIRRSSFAAPTTSIKVEKGRSYDIELVYTNDKPGFAFLSFDICQRELPDFKAVAESVKDADLIVVVTGLSARLEGEEMPVSFDGFNGGDRTKIELPDVQRELLAAMDATGKKVVLVNCTGSAVAFGEDESRYDALVQAWYDGQAAGLAIADVLFGDYNPAGRLPVTFYASTDQLPPFENYDMEGHTYRYFRGTPLYAFGYGLSYTDFNYGAAKLSKKSIRAGETVDITVPVTNAGARDGEEVVQIYIKSLDNPEAPIKSLKGFKRVSIAAGATAKVKINLGKETFEYYDASIDELSPKPGKYQILYGSSSRDEDLKSLDFEVLDKV